MTWVTNDCNNGEVPLPPFLRNKIAQTLVSVLQVRCKSLYNPLPSWVLQSTEEPLEEHCVC